jgi:hypothetical protein
MLLMDFCLLQLVLGAVHRELQAKLKQAAAEAAGMSGSPTKYYSTPSSVASWAASSSTQALPTEAGLGSAAGGGGLGAKEEAVEEEEEEGVQQDAESGDEHYVAAAAAQDEADSGD